MILTVYLSQTISFYLNPSLSLSLSFYLCRSLLKRATRVCECESEFVCVWVCKCVSVSVCVLLWLTVTVTVTVSVTACMSLCLCVCRVGGKGLALRETWIISVLGRTIVCFYGHPIGKSHFFIYIKANFGNSVPYVWGGGAVWKYWITGVLGKNAELWVSHSGKHSYLYTLIVQIKVKFFCTPIPSLKTYQSSKGKSERSLPETVRSFKLK